MLYACSIVILTIWAVTVPGLFKFKLTRNAAVLAIVMYGTYQVLYIYTIIREARGEGDGGGGRR